jgi:hypothetical protein
LAKLKATQEDAEPQPAPQGEAPRMAAAPAAAPQAHAPTGEHRLVAIGRQLEQEGEAAEAEKMYRTVLADNPHEGAALHRLGVLLAKRGELAAAEEHLRAAVVRLPGNVELMNDLGYCCFLQGRHAEAEGAYRLALEIDPQHQTTRNNLARVVRQRALAETRSYPKTPAAQEVVAPIVTASPVVSAEPAVTSAPVVTTAPAAIKIRDVAPPQAPPVARVEQPPRSQPKPAAPAMASTPPSENHSPVVKPVTQPRSTSPAQNAPAPAVAPTMPAIVLEAGPPADASAAATGSPENSEHGTSQESGKQCESCLTFVDPKTLEAETQTETEPVDDDAPAPELAADAAPAVTEPTPEATPLRRATTRPDDVPQVAASDSVRSTRQPISETRISAAPAPMPVVRLATPPQGVREVATTNLPANSSPAGLPAHGVSRVARTSPAVSPEGHAPSALRIARSEPSEPRTGHHAGHAETAAADAAPSQETAPRRRNLLDAVMGLTRPEEPAAAKVSFDDASAFTEYSSGAPAAPTLRAEPLKPAHRAGPASHDNHSHAKPGAARRSGFRSSLRAFNPFGGD